LIRMHPRVGDRPYEATWNDWMDKLFAWFDKNGDGTLNAVETARIPHAQTLQFQLQGSIGANPQAVLFSTLDTNNDGKVSKEEFRAYYRANGMGGLRFFFNNSEATNAKRVNDSIYKRLDADKDGRLTQAELARLPQLLRQLDENEDELLTAQELNTE